VTSAYIQIAVRADDQYWRTCESWPDDANQIGSRLISPMEILENDHPGTARPMPQQVEKSAENPIPIGSRERISELTADTFRNVRDRREWTRG
jgi:hypothetical protein